MTILQRYMYHNEGRPPRGTSPGGVCWGPDGDRLWSTQQGTLSERQTKCDRSGGKWQYCKSSYQVPYPTFNPTKYVNFCLGEATPGVPNTPYGNNGMTREQIKAAIKSWYSKPEDPRDWAGAEFACSGPDMIKPKDYCLNNWSKKPWQGCLDWSAKWKNSNPVKAEFERTKCKCQHGEGRKWTAKHGHDNLYANCEDW